MGNRIKKLYKSDKLILIYIAFVLFCQKFGFTKNLHNNYSIMIFSLHIK